MSSVISVPSESSRGSTASVLAGVLRDHAAIIGIAVVLLVSAFCVRYLVVPDQSAGFSLYAASYGILAFLFIFFFALGHALYVMVIVRPEWLLLHIWKDWRNRFLAPQRLTQGVLILLLVYPFISSFSFFKSLIPVIQPFYLDETLMRLDRFLHGGIDPWIWLHTVLGSPFVTFVVNVFYNVWIFILYGIVFWQAFSRKDPAVRQQFLMTFLLLWICLGVVAATALSSAGPVYYGRVTGLEDPYSPLMAYLETTNELYPIWALKVQNVLWAAYESGVAIPGRGISAMPSLHVATSVLFALLGWKTNRLLGALLSVFALIVLIGSVHLGWHYAADGYASIVLTLLIWKAVGHWVRTRWEPASSRTGLAWTN